MGYSGLPRTLKEHSWTWTCQEVARQLELGSELRKSRPNAQATSTGTQKKKKSVDRPTSRMILATWTVSSIVSSRAQQEATGKYEFALARSSRSTLTDGEPDRSGSVLTLLTANVEGGSGAYYSVLL